MLQQIGAVVAAELCQQHGLDAEDAHHPAGNGALISARMCDELLEASLHVAARRLAAASNNFKVACGSFRALFDFFHLTEIGTKALRVSRKELLTLKCTFERFLSRSTDGQVELLKESLIKKSSTK